jgi:hypothetical protein
LFHEKLKEAMLFTMPSREFCPWMPVRKASVWKRFCEAWLKVVTEERLSA